MPGNFLNEPQYQLFRRAVSERIAPLVLVAGSGLSAPAGLPDWKRLRADLQIQLNNYQSSLEANGVEYDAFAFKEAVKTDDYWIFFKSAKKLLSPATFNELVRQELDPPDLKVPPAYAALLALKPKGLVTLNLDRISSTAIASAYPGRPIPTINGTELQYKWNVLKEESPFLVHLHGHVIDSSTWVLDQDELTNLTSNVAHSLFLSSLYMDNTVLLVGVSADDIALSAPLLRLRQAGLEPHRLFWFTNRSDAKTTRWAADNHVQLIRYTATTQAEHEAAIGTFVANVRGFRSLDDIPPPTIAPPKAFNPTLQQKTPDEIALLPPDEVRKSLSDLLWKSLDGLHGDALYDRFVEFCDEYNFPIFTRAFYRHRSGHNAYFFDYKLQFPELGSGNFGTVYAAKSATGADVAIKVMHDNILNAREMLGGFRRGSRSMRILTDRSVAGIAKIIAAYEMPPTIVMELVPGNSLEELFSEVANMPWLTKAAIGRDISVIVDSCHKLPEMVLHRDIKPSNVIVSGYDYTDKTYADLVVLDFDMSWHKGSSEKDVVFESRDDFGYLAPEQTDSQQLGNARSAKVDSYGLGMTLFALFAGRHPIPNMPMADGWTDAVNRAVRVSYIGSWTCLPMRMARTICEATAVSHSDRLEFSSLAHRLFRIAEAMTSSTQVTSDVFAEEIVAQLARNAWQYEWDDIADKGALMLPGGFQVQVEADIATGRTSLSVTFQDPGGAAYKRRDEMLRSCRTELEKGFQRDGAKIENATVRSGFLSFIANLSLPRTISSAREVAAVVESAMRPLREQG